VVKVAVNVVLAARLLEGVNVATVHGVLQVTLPVTAVLLCVINVNVELVMVDEFIGMLKVAVSAVFSATSVALLVGVTAVTEGTGAGIVVKLHV
jgi:hypothetical protein